MSAPEDGPGFTPEIREIADAREEAQGVSSELFDVLALRGTVSRAGPGVALYGDLDPETFYRVHHPWSVTDVPVADMRRAMERLRAELPGRGWTVRRYGPDTSPNRNLELVADKDERRYVVSVRFMDRSGTEGNDGGRPPSGTNGTSGIQGTKSRVFVDLVSTCFRVPEGRTVDEY